ncbi:hypothetical protein ACFV1C_38310, partial [Streptomyces sp. NPDC059605]|uniref:hypothetical protein n=1 Tax=Streptomyces sp. NPDC059605 TaxID=3346882 RepID=UPI003693DB2F
MAVGSADFEGVADGAVDGREAVADAEGDGEALGEAGADGVAGAGEEEGEADAEAGAGSSDGRVASGRLATVLGRACSWSVSPLPPPRSPLAKAAVPTTAIATAPIAAATKGLRRRSVSSGR